jgi:hypothetical protein
MFVLAEIDTKYIHADLLLFEIPSKVLSGIYHLNSILPILIVI